MKVIRCGEVASAIADPSYFTGTVLQQPIHAAPDPARAAAVLVTFLPGARTNWHTHPLGQTIHVTTGAGWCQREGEAKVEIRAGDTVWFEPGERHWHGATDRTAMAHIAIHEREGTVSADWAEPVAEADYLR